MKLIKKYYRPLDGLRGIAILLILFHHLLIFDPKIYEFFSRIISNGWIGVDLFFLLSGFLITGNLLDTKKNKKYFIVFFTKRILRIFPLYYLFLFIIFLLFPLLYSNDKSSIDLFKSSLFWYYTHLTNIGMVFDIGLWLPFATSHLWSLSVEEQFYIIWPFVVLFIDRKYFIIFCISICVISPIFRWLLLELDIFSDNHYSNINIVNFSIYILTPCRLDGFVFGAIISYIIRYKDPKFFIDQLKRLFFFSLLLLIIIFIYTKGNFGWDQFIVQTFGYSALSLFFGLILYSSICEFKFLNFLNSDILVFFGRYSYSMYLFHMPIHYIVTNSIINNYAFFYYNSLLKTFLCFAISMIFTIIVSILTWNICEKHFIKIKNRLVYSN